MLCIFCKNELRDTAKFCPYCGKKVEIPENEVPKKEEISAESTGNTEIAEAEAVKEVITENQAAETEIATGNDTETEENISEAEEKDESKEETEQISDDETDDKNTENEPIAEAVEETSAISKKDSEIAGQFDEKDGLFFVKESEKHSEKSAENAVRRKKIPVVKTSVAVACILLACICAYVIPVYAVPAIKYEKAVQLYEDGDFKAARKSFSEFDSYKESHDYILKCDYGIAEALMSSGFYPEAADAFTALNGYADSDNRAEECMLIIADNYFKEGNYDAAVSVYAAAGKTELARQTAVEKAKSLAANGDFFGAAEVAAKFCDEDVVNEYTYQGALAAKNDGNFKTAADNFYRLGTYKDSAQLAEESTYGFYKAEYAEKGASEEIVRGFYFLGNYNDSKDLFVQTAYEYGQKCMENGDYSAAAAMFKNSGNYKGAPGELYKARYELGKVLLEEDPASARSVFAMLSTYYDSAQKKKTATEKIPDDHKNWYADGFTSTGSYFTTFFRKTDTLLITCTAGMEAISPPVTLVLTFRDSSGTEVSADCENIRNSGSFSGSFSLASASSGNAEIIISRKDNGAVLRTIEIMIAD